MFKVTTTAKVNKDNSVSITARARGKQRTIHSRYTAEPADHATAAYAVLAEAMGVANEVNADSASETPAGFAFVVSYKG